MFALFLFPYRSCASRLYALAPTEWLKISCGSSLPAMRYIRNDLRLYVAADAATSLLRPTEVDRFYH